MHRPAYGNLLYEAVLENDLGGRRRRGLSEGASGRPEQQEGLEAAIVLLRTISHFTYEMFKNTG